MLIASSIHTLWLGLDSSADQGLTVVHFPAQRKHFLWDTLGTFIRNMGHKSSQTGHKRLTDQNGSG